MARRIVFSFLALLCAVAPALAQSSAGSGAGGGSSGGGGPATQSGAWNVGIAGTLPAFAATPTFNVGTIAGIATDSSVQAVKTALGSPFQAGGSIANTAFGISGTLPAFAATPTVNLGTLNGAATAAAQATGNGSLASIDGKTPALGTLTKAGSRSVTPASDLANIEPAGGGHLGGGHAVRRGRRHRVAVLDLVRHDQPVFAVRRRVERRGRGQRVHGRFPASGRVGPDPVDAVQRGVQFDPGRDLLPTGVERQLHEHIQCLDRGACSQRRSLNKCAGCIHVLPRVHRQR